MQKVLNLLSEIKDAQFGILVYSELKQDTVLSVNKELDIPLASAAKVAIAFCIAKYIEENIYSWDDVVEDIHFNPKEDSHQLYPHFQHRDSLPLRDAVEVMIACHDSYIANSVVKFAGGWEKINDKIQRYFKNINVTDNPRELKNSGRLGEVFELLKLVFQGYKMNSELWVPIISGLVRQQDKIEGIPVQNINQMTGGLDNVVIDIGIIGEFSKSPLLFVLGAKNLPNRSKETFADERIQESIRLIYENYLNQDIHTKK